MIALRVWPKHDCDVLVAGAGPAGTSAAARLATAGLRVMVLDRMHFPRDKVCGDFVGPAALIELEALGIAAGEGYARSNVIRQAAVHLDGRLLIRRALPEVEGLPAFGRCIPRLTLDAWCLDAARRAGATIMEGMRVTGFDVRDDAVVVQAQQGTETRAIRARLLIGADGSSSTVSRVLRGSAPPSDDRIIAVRAYYDGDIGHADQADLYFAAESFPGYYWLFPTGGGRANVGVGMVLETLPPTSDHLRELLLGLVERDAALHARLARGRIVGKVLGWPLTTYNASLPLVAERVMVVGDAAGFINPLNGEGIQYALMSGRWAAECAIQSLAEDDTSERRLRMYADQAEHELRYDMALAGLIVQLIRNRHLNGLWLEALKVIAARARADREYSEITGGILAGLVPARDALTAKVIGRTLDQVACSLAGASVVAALKGPTHLRASGRAAILEGATTAASAMADPASLADWISGVLRHVVELATQYGGHLAGPRAGTPHPRPAALTPQSVHLRLPSAMRC
jgi:geranylgeranyl reductase family protein